MKVKELKNIFHANRNDKKAGVAILISDKLEFKIKSIKRDKGHYTDERINILVYYALNIEHLASQVALRQCRSCSRCRFDPWVRKIPWRRA